MADNVDVMGAIVAEVEAALGGGRPVAVATVMDVGEQQNLRPGTKMLVRHHVESASVGALDNGPVDEAVRESVRMMFETFPRVPLQTLYVSTEHEAVTRRSQAQPGDARIMLELFEAPARLVICGGGHVGLAIASIAQILGFDITVIDDRAEFANTERFPMAKEVICGDFGEIIDNMNIDLSSNFVLVSRGHQQDTLALRHALVRDGVERDPGYVGMIGSRRRVSTVLTHLEEEGIPASALAKVHTPIGLDIGAETPEEIALAILAEIVLVRKGGTGQMLSTLRSRRQADREGAPSTGLR